MSGRPTNDLEPILEQQEMRGERWVAWIRLGYAVLGLAMLAGAWPLNTDAANRGFLLQGVTLIAWSGVVLLALRVSQGRYQPRLKYASIFVDLFISHASFAITAVNHSGVIEFYHGFFPLTIAAWNLLSGLRFRVAACLWSAGLSALFGGVVLGATVGLFGQPALTTIVTDRSVFGAEAINPGDEAMRIFFVVLPAFLAAVFAWVARGLILRAEHQSRERARLEQERARLAKYLSPELAELLSQDGSPLDLGGTRRRATILFSDIRNFTPLAEGTEPEEVVRLLNQYFTEMVSIVFRYGGTLDKFLGDGLMAQFGVPFDQDEPELRATAVAVEMVAAVEALNRRLDIEGRGLPPLRIGVGIATGTVVAGNIGSPDRMEYTSIGDTVNFAARLEALNKTLGTSILVSESTAEALRGRVQVELLPPQEVKGRSGVSTVYAVRAEALTAEVLLAARALSRPSAPAAQA